MVSDRTSNNELPLPASGTHEGEWGTVVMNNDMTDKLETKVPIRDFESNLTDYTPHDGAKFEATDTENVYYGDGSDWIQADSRGQEPTFTNVTVTDSFETQNGATISEGVFTLGTLTDISAALNSATSDTDEDSFYMEFADEAGSSPAATIRWLRDAANGYAFRVTDSDAGNALLTVDDNGGLDLHGNDMENVSEIWSGTSSGASIDLSNGEIKTGGSDWSVHDTANSQDIIRFLEGNGVEIVQGGLSVLNGTITSNGQLIIEGSIDMKGNDILNGLNLTLDGSNAQLKSGSNETDNLYVYNPFNDENFIELENGTTNVNMPQGLESGGNPVPYSSEGTEYDIQKNGQDGAGIINFKTS